MPAITLHAGSCVASGSGAPAWSPSWQDEVTSFIRKNGYTGDVVVLTAADASRLPPAGTQFATAWTQIKTWVTKYGSVQLRTHGGG